MSKKSNLPKRCFARGACGLFVNAFFSLDDVFAVVPRAEPELRMSPDVVEKGELFVPISN